MDLSIILPVLNEQSRICLAIERLYSQAFRGTMQIIVSDGDPTGSTIACIDDPSIITTISSPGRGSQMNAGAALATGKILLFLHCDTVLPENGLKLVFQLMDNQQVDVGAFDLSIDKKGFLFRIIEKVSSLRSRMTRLPYGDQALFIRRSYFFDIGQYKQIPIMEDVDLMRRIKKDRTRPVFLNSSVITSARRWEKEGALFCTLRNWVILTLYFLGVRPEKLVRLYRTHTI